MADGDSLDTWARRHGIAGETLGELRDALRHSMMSADASWLFEDSDEGESPTELTGMRVLGRLGAGGMGEVLQAFDEDLRRVVALKVLHPRLAERDDAVRRFLTEAQVTAQLQHPGIVPVHQLGRLPDGRAYFTMKRIEGHTLRVEIERLHGRDDGEAPTLRAVLGIFRRVCEAIAYAHDRGVVHRDLKPDNVMVGRFGQVHVLDWGLARVLANDRPSWDQVDTVRTEGPGTRVGAVAGTLRYMAPEQARGEVHRIGCQTDVYALGLILWEILEGHSPFADVDHDGLQIVAERAVPRPRSEHAPDLVAICTQALQREPADRYPSAEPLADALASWLDGAQRRSEAMALVREADALVPQEKTLREEAAQHLERGTTLMAAVPPGAEAAQKEPGWEALDRSADLTRQASDLAWDRTALLEAALTRDPAPEALDALARFHHREHAKAEAAHDDGAALRHLRQLRRYDRGQYRAYLDGGGHLSLHTAPAGATAQLHRFELQGRRLVPRYVRDLSLPVDHLPLPMGSYLLVLSCEGHETVRYPVHIARGQHWTSTDEAGVTRPVQLPTAGSLGPDDVYIPEGWFITGIHKPLPDTRPESRMWIDSWVVRKFPVTNAEYIAFLDDLVAQGREEEAIRWAPQERSSRPKEPGPPCYGRTASGGFELVPDADGDLWDPRWPVFLVGWGAASAYAAWLAEKTAQPWQLAPEFVWEKAARGVDGREFPWGPHVDPAFCLVRGSRASGAAPGTIDEFPSDVSVYGVRGTGGNVRDWCADRIGDEAAVRGGCWYFAKTAARSVNRYVVDVNMRGATVGFRVARPWG